jgi:hypothetical protein
MKRKIKLRVEDLQVTSLASEGESGGVHAAARTYDYYSVCGVECASQDGRLCVTKEFGGGETCESGPYYYC